MIPKQKLIMEMVKYWLEVGPLFYFFGCLIDNGTELQRGLVRASYYQIRSRK
jgi:hypothetical protein